jgi:hypothetical protein
MRHLAAVLLFAGAVLAAAPLAAQATGFVAGTEDIPLMPGLRNQENTLVVFDKPQGRIVAVEARGKVTRAAAEKFYATSLPPLGWIADGPHRWSREGEGLQLEITGRDGDLHIGFSLAPR